VRRCWFHARKQSRGGNAPRPRRGCRAVEEPSWLGPHTTVRASVVLLTPRTRPASPGSRG
jgi:hypothetical protein